jgi:cell division protein FtsB
MMLTGFNPNQIENIEGAHEAILHLLNLIETLKVENDQLRDENQRLRDEVNRLKGEQGKPDIKARRKKSKKRISTNYSSEQERREPRERRKKSKNDRIEIDREQVLEVDRDLLPEDAEFKGYEEVIVQDIEIKTDNVRFRKEKYYSPSEGKAYMAELPPGYKGQFGPGIKAWVYVLYFAMNVTEAKIVSFFETVGVSISAGKVSEILLKDSQPLHAEKAEIVAAGLGSTPWQQIDDTGARVGGENWYTQVICNPLYTAYFTTPRKDRLTVLRVLRGGQDLTFVLNEVAFVYLEVSGLSRIKRKAVTALPRNQVFSRVEFEALLDQHLPDLGPQHRRWILEAAAVAAYHDQDELPIVALLLCDDAGQFKRLTEALALCWVHEGRHYKKLMPAIDYHRQLLDDFLSKFWAFYRQLLAYRLEPTSAEQERLTTEFDQLFVPATGYQALDDRIIKTKAKKKDLLRVLEHPEIPLHNNAAELGARLRKPKKNISFGPRTTEGAKVWDAALTLVATARKLDVSIYAYIYDRLSAANQMPSLASLIEQNAAGGQLGASWQPEPPETLPSIY